MTTHAAMCCVCIIRQHLQRALQLNAARAQHLAPSVVAVPIISLQARNVCVCDFCSRSAGHPTPERLHTTCVAGQSRRVRKRMRDSAGGGLHAHTQNKATITCFVVVRESDDVDGKTGRMGSNRKKPLSPPGRQSVWRSTGCCGWV